MTNACGCFPMEHEEIVAWVKAHEDVLSADLATIARYPVPFRKVIVKMVSEERHLALWQEHLAGASAADATLTDEQRAFVAETAAALPVIFSSASAMSDWEARTADRFTREQHFALFGSLGPPEPPGGLPLPPDAKPTATA